MTCTQTSPYYIIGKIALSGTFSNLGTAWPMLILFTYIQDVNVYIVEGGIKLTHPHLAGGPTIAWLMLLSEC